MNRAVSPALPASVSTWMSHLFTRVLFPGSPDPKTGIRTASLLLVLILPAAILYPTLGFHLLEPDEGRYAQIPREMIASGNWVVPTLEGEAYLDKPPLMYWLIAASYRVLAVSPEAARIVPAICVHLTILAVYLIGRRSIGERGAMWAAVLLSVAPGFISVARLLLLDGLLVLCVTVSVLCGFEAVRTGRMRLGWWTASAIASGLGFLTKGPISEVLLFVPLWAYAWLANPTPPSLLGKGAGGLGSEGTPSPGPCPKRGGEEETAPTLPGKGVGGLGSVWSYLLFFAIVFAVNVPWYVAIYLQEPEFLKYFFWEHNVMRFLKPFDHLQPVWYYVPILLGGLLPTTFLFVWYFRDLFGDRSTGFQTVRPSLAGGFWLLAGTWCVFFFSCSGSKLPTYILPAYPFLCLAIGEYVARSRWNAAPSTRFAIAAMAGIILLVHHVGLPWYARERSPYGRPELVERFVRDPGTVVVSYPRNCDSLAFYMGRDDFQKVRTKDTNQLMVDCHHRPRTVILFTHRDSLQGFRNTMPPSLEIVEEQSMRREYAQPILDKLFGSTPWGLCDVAVVVPARRTGFQPVRQ